MRIRDEKNWDCTVFGMRDPGKTSRIRIRKTDIFNYIIELITRGIDKIVQKTALVCNNRNSGTEHTSRDQKHELNHMSRTIF
jgi:hypothetical protein